MEISELLAILALICALISIYSGVLIAKDLRARGLSVKPALVRWMIFKYMADYRRVTLQETGEVGPLYQQCATISSITGLLAISAIIAKLLF